MSSFFTLPTRKRKRVDASATALSKRRVTTVSRDAKNAKLNRDARSPGDESISSSGSETHEKGCRASHDNFSSGSGSEDETGAERRLRLAKQYLQNVKNEVDEIGFDAEEIDKDLVAERLQEDVAETKGRLYRHLAATLAFSASVNTQFRSDTDTTTSIAACPPYAYTVSKDITLSVWKLPGPSPLSHNSKLRAPLKRAPLPKPRRPKKLLSRKGNKKNANDSSYNHHTAPILAVAASSSGRFVVTGGADKRLIVWSSADLTPLRVFTQHRDAVTSLAFRRGTNQLYSASKDRTIKTWSLDELAYVETLFGHQDEVVDVAALAREQCISVGARDRTARLWKVADETQLVFRGGGGGPHEKKKAQVLESSGDERASSALYAEGSIDCVALVDEETFVTGSDNGALSLWHLHKKKPIFVVRAAHGFDPLMEPKEAFAEEDPNQDVWGQPQPRWITALSTIPYSDLVLSGSWDGEVRVWKVSEDKRSLEALGIVGKMKVDAANDEHQWSEECKPTIRGIINDIDVFERLDRGKDGICIVVATGREHRLGRWKKVEGKNGAMVLEVPKLLHTRTNSGKVDGSTKA